MNKLATKVLDDILKLNETSLKQYEILAELDINEKNKSEEYQDTLKNIKIIAEVIAKKLANLKISDEDLLRYEASLAKKYNFEDEDILVETLYQNTHDLAAKRLSMQIFNYSLMNYCYVIEEEYIAEEYEGHEDEVCEVVEDDAKKEIDFELIKDRLINHTFLAYLDNAIKNETNEDVKNILIRTKYKVIYLLYPIETNFLKKQDKYVNPNLIQEIIGYQEKNVDLEELFINPNEQIITDHLESIADIPNEYFDSFENNVKLYLLSIYIKTLISINISKPSESRLKIFREKLKLKSTKSKKYIDEAYNISKNLSVVKKVDF